MPGQFFKFVVVFFDKLGFFFYTNQLKLTSVFWTKKYRLKSFVEILYDISRKILSKFFVHRLEIVYNFGENILNTKAGFPAD